MRTLELDDLKVREMRVILALTRSGSVRDTARQFNVSPGQISKVLKLVEERVGQQIVERSQTGIHLHPNAQPIVDRFSEIVTSLDLLESNKKETQQSLRFAGTSLLANEIWPLTIAEFNKDTPDLRARVLDFAPAELINQGLRNAFDLCLHFEDLDWPKTWISTQVGEIEWHLYARAKHTIPLEPKAQEVKEQRFVVPMYWSAGGAEYGNDQCPLPLNQRKIGAETVTADAAANFVVTSDMVAFLPELLMRQKLKGRVVKQLKPKSWKRIKRPVYLTARADRVKDKVFSKLIQILERQIAR